MLGYVQLVHFLPCRICMVTPRGVVIGSVDSLQKLHVRKIPLYETPRRIILQEETYSIGLITLHTESVLDNGAFTALRPSISSDRTVKVGQTNCTIHKSSCTHSPFNYPLFVLPPINDPIIVLQILRKSSTMWKFPVSLFSANPPCN